MPGSEQTVFIVDDDSVICSGISQLVETVGLKTECFVSAQQFLNSYIPNCAGCLVLDVRMPEMSGLLLQDELATRNSDLPIIFITGHGNVKMGVDTIKKGAIDYIEKPFDDQVLLDQIHKALKKNSKIMQERMQKQMVVARIESLTPKEKQIMYMVADGKLNKVIAYELEISQKTIEFHRSHAMKKMKVDSVAHLVKLLDSIEMPSLAP